IDNIDQYQNLRVIITNRWGQIVFDKQGYNNSSSGAFTGISDAGEKLRQGAYQYVVVDGETVIRKGTVNIFYPQDL
ncbi:MAG: gliding motility-associated C-terminal domain-containing protein, partial [Bacteroidetes bacterium]|nr:gliding motility-associated C-terminal domain-containing protein [Bacteroidota bacterium]